MKRFSSEVLRIIHIALYYAVFYNSVCQCDKSGVLFFGCFFALLSDLQYEFELLYLIVFSEKGITVQHLI